MPAKQRLIQSSLPAAALFLSSLLWAPAALSETCGDNAPAMPTPQFMGSVELWPDNFRPGQPGQTLPSSRDSTQYLSTTIPSWRSGHELFWAISAVDPWIFVAYNVGIQAWDVEGSRAESPVLVDFEDGLEGHWLFHPPGGETDGVIRDIDAIQDPNDADKIIVAVSATSPVGISIWRFSRSSRNFHQSYQVTTRESTDVDLVSFGGNVYALFASTAGPFVVDASAASLLGGCLDSECPSTVHRGRIGAAANARYINGLVKDNALHVLSSFGGISGATPLPELWVMSDAQLPGNAVRRFQGTVRDSHSGVMFKKGNFHYLGVVENKKVRIYSFDDCLDASGCTGLGSPLFENSLRNQNWDDNYLTYSESEGTPFLYYGCSNCFFQSGDAIERLFDLSNLGGSNVIPEITATGGTYSDADQPNNPCATAHSGIGYWSHQYAANRYGLRNFNPRKGLFNGLYFYRVTTATFDVHVRTASSTHPETSTATVGAPPFWLGEPVNFVATAQNCDGAESWNFQTDPYTFGVLGTGANDATASLTWNLCTTDDCPTVTTDVWATKDACVSAPDLEVNSVTVSLADPRPRVRSITTSPAGSPPDSFPLCSVLTFSANIDGKTPFSYQWVARSASGSPLATSSNPTFVWNTQGVQISEDLFADGFESGDISNWSIKAAAPVSAAPTAADIVAGSGGSAPFTIELTVTNPNIQRDVESKVVTLNQLGPLGYGSPEITVTSLGNGLFRFVANTQNATTWRWEFEDNAFGTLGACQILSASRCFVIAAGADDNDVTYQWAPPNTDGLYGVAVTANNCNNTPLPSSPLFEINVTGITQTANPTVSNFRVNPTAWDPGDLCDPDSAINSTYFCHINEAIPFLVTAADATHLQFDWDRDGVYEDERSVTATITKTWTAVGPLATGKPRVRARSGATIGNPVDLVKNLTFLP